MLADNDDCHRCDAVVAEIAGEACWMPRFDLGDSCIAAAAVVEYAVLTVVVAAAAAGLAVEAWAVAFVVVADFESWLLAAAAVAAVCYSRLNCR